MSHLIHPAISRPGLRQISREVAAEPELPHTESSLPPSPSSNQRAGGRSARQNLACFICAWGDRDPAQIQTTSGVRMPQRWQGDSGKPGSPAESLLVQTVTVSVGRCVCVSRGSSVTFGELPEAACGWNNCPCSPGPGSRGSRGAGPGGGPCWPPFGSCSSVGTEPVPQPGATLWGSPAWLSGPRGAGARSRERWLAVSTLLCRELASGSGWCGGCCRLCPSSGG